MKKLVYVTEGQGPPLLLLHGWGMNSHVWQGIYSLLIENYQVTYLDLPGHGHNKHLSLNNLDDMVEQVLPLIKQNTTILGWSLGGLVAQRLQQKIPSKITALILVASTPCFVKKKTWLPAMEAQLLTTFSENLQKNYRLTLKQFLALQFIAVKNKQHQLRDLTKNILSSPVNQQALQAGLKILQTTDFRRALAKTTIKKLWILGKQDKLVPVGLVKELKHYPNSQVKILKDAGHAPFISHPEAFVKIIQDFLSQ